MKLLQLRQLVALHEHGTFSKAAQAMYLSQPTLSVSIRELEEELNAQLIFRSNRGIVFTPVGERVLKRAEKILEEVEQIHQICRDANLSGELYIASTPHYCVQILLDVKQKIEQSHPAAVLHLLENDSFSILHQVLAGRVDVGMIQLCDLDERELWEAVNSGRLRYQELFEEEMCVSVIEPHPLSKQGQVEVKDLLRYPYGSYKQATNSWVAQLLKENGLPHRIFRINDIAPLRIMQARENAYTVIPKRCIPAGNAMYHSKMVPLPVRGVHLTSKIGLIHRKTASSALSETVISALRVQCGTYQSEFALDD